MLFRETGAAGRRYLLWLLASMMAWSGISPAASATSTPKATQTSAPSASRPADGVPLHQEIVYYGATLKHGIPISGTAKRSILRQKDGLWQYRFDVDSFFADIHEWVDFKYDGGHVIPEHYHYQLTGWAVPDRSTDLGFDWEKRQVTDLHSHKVWSIQLHQGVLDKLGSQLQLRQDIKAGKKDLHYAVAEDGKLEDYHFAVVGPETLNTRKLGKLDTLRVREVRPPGKKRKTILWFAPQWDYLLVKLLQVEPDGTQYQIFLDHAQLPGKRIGDWSKSGDDKGLLPQRSHH